MKVHRWKREWQGERWTTTKAFQILLSVCYPGERQRLFFLFVFLFSGEMILNDFHSDFGLNRKFIKTFFFRFDEFAKQTEQKKRNRTFRLKNSAQYLIVRFSTSFGQKIDWLFYQFFELIVQMQFFGIHFVDDRRSIRCAAAVSIHLEFGDARIFLTEFGENFFLSKRAKVTLDKRETDRKCRTEKWKRCPVVLFDLRVSFRSDVFVRPVRFSSVRVTEIDRCFLFGDVRLRSEEFLSKVERAKRRFGLSFRGKNSNLFF